MFTIRVVFPCGTLRFVGGETMRGWDSTLKVVSLVGLLTVAGGERAAVNAAIITWDLSSVHDLLGPTQAYAAGGYTIVASGFTGGEPNPPGTTPTPFWTPTDLYGKHEGGDESGLGIASDPTGDDEIWGSTFIVIDFSGPFAAGYRTYQFEMGSTTYGEGWNVYGTNDTPGPSATLRPVYIDGTDELVKHTLSGYRYYLFSSNGGVVDPGQGDNALLFKTFTAIPEPSTLAMLMLGFAGLGYAGHRRARAGRPTLAA
jgi:hypothetical protein